MNYYTIDYCNRPVGESGESCNSEYDLQDACESCGSGAELKGHLRTKGLSGSKKDFFETLDGDFIISKRLFDRIQRVHSDFILQPVVDSKNKELDFYHLTASTVLPPFEKCSKGYAVEGQCEHCKRNGLFNTAEIGDIEQKTKTVVHPLCLAYKREDIEKLQNILIVKTWERVGLSNKVAHDHFVVRYARPWMIIHQDLKDIFESENVEGISYESIELV